MSQLSATHISSIVTLVEPFCRTENERRALIDTVFAGTSSQPDIDISGAPLEFTRRLIFRLRDFGEIEPGKPALWALLETIRVQVGIDKQTQIDALRAAIVAAAVPTAEYVVIAEGGKRLFISYARADFTLVERLRADLQAAGFNLWIDRKGLKVGQSNWQREIRKALTNADAVIYVGSPTAADSDHVGAEIVISKEKHKPIYCVWADGTLWSDAAQIGLVMAQYADLRAGAYAAGFAELVDSLRDEGTNTPHLALVTSEAPPPDFTPINPYKGLRAFQVADRDRFFGRAAFVETLLAHLRADPRFLAVIGASGSGKSSVIMAGLLPRLSDGDAIPGSADWRILEPFKPGKQPLEALTDQLGRHLPQLLPSDIRRELDDESARGLLRLARRITSTRLILYIDQFEELFTLTENDAERRQFIDLITTAANEPDSPITILLTLRADFYDRPLAYAELGTLVTRAAVPILPMTVTELFAAVREPAALASARLTFDDGLVEELVFAVNDEAGALPLLQFTLDLLFEHREGMRLTWDAYNALGGMRGALANYAESVYQSLSDEGRRMARVLFLRLIEPGATEQDTTRRRAAQSELAYADTAQTALMQSVAKTFVDARLLTQDHSGDTETIEVSHEALIREWERLRGWLHDSREDVMLMKRIASDADEWARAERDDALVYEGRRLADASRWAERGQPNATEAAFIAAGAAKAEHLQGEERERQAERLRLAEDKAAAEERARIAEKARANRAWRAAILGVMLVGIAACSFFTIVSAMLGQEGANAALTVTALYGESTTLEYGATFSALEINRFSTLNAGNVVVPLRTQTPGTFEPTLTQVAALNARMPAPPIEVAGIPLVEVPAGCFFMGSTLYTDTQPIEPQCFDPPFWIGLTEITNAQYAAFIEAGGYEDRAYWTEDGWTWRTGEDVTQPEYWADSTYNQPEQPIVGVSWYEAVAYTNWLTEVYQNLSPVAGATPSLHNVERGLGGEVIFRLPTEAEWEYAARGPNSRVYPWGNEWNGDNAVTFESGANAPAVVGSRPGGASWVGTLDTGGNVWEWVSSRYAAYPYAEDEREVLNGTDTRVLRGGSWISDQGFARAVYRVGGVGPLDRSGDLGFRVVLGAPST